MSLTMGDCYASEMRTWGKRSSLLLLQVLLPLICPLCEQSAMRPSSQGTTKRRRQLVDPQKPASLPHPVGSIPKLNIQDDEDDDDCSAKNPRPSSLSSRRTSTPAPSLRTCRHRASSFDQSPTLLCPVGGTGCAFVCMRTIRLRRLRDWGER